MQLTESLPNILVINPPSANPMQPPASLAALVGMLRASGFSESSALDLNVVSWIHLYKNEEGVLAHVFDERDRLLTEMNRRNALSYQEARRLLYLEATRSLSFQDIAASCEYMKSKDSFADRSKYHRARNSLEGLNVLMGAVFDGLKFGYSKCEHEGSLLLPEALNPFAKIWAALLHKKVPVSQLRLVGLSVNYSSQLAPALSLIRMLRGLIPNCHFVIGGAIPTRIVNYMSHTVLDLVMAEVDSIVVGEGETPLVRLAEHIIHQVPLRAVNLVHRDAEGNIEVPKYVHFEDIGKLPIPDWSDLDLSSYLTPDVVLTYDAVRGCYWGKCAFCSYGLATYNHATAPYRERSPEVIAGHLETFRRSYGARNVIFADDAIHPRMLGKVARALARIGTPVKIAIEIRADRPFDSEFCRLLFNGGIRQVFFGIESANGRVLELMNKGINPENFRQLYENLHSVGIFVGIQTFIGFPGETFEESMETLRHIEDCSEQLSLAANWDFSLLVGSDVYNNPARYCIEKIVKPSGVCYYEEVNFKTSYGSPSPDQYAALEEARKRITIGDRDPWAGSAMSSHTFLCAERLGNNCFREWKREVQGSDYDTRFLFVESYFDLAVVANSASQSHNSIEKTNTTHRVSVNEVLFPVFPCYW